MRWKPVLIFACSEPRRPSIGSQPNVPLNVVRFHAERFWTSDAWHQSYIVQLFHVAFDMNLMQDVAAFKVNNDEATDRLHAVLVRNAIAHQVLDALVFQGSERVCCREGREIRRRPEIVLHYRFPAAHGRNSQKLRPVEQLYPLVAIGQMKGCVDTALVATDHDKIVARTLFIAGDARRVPTVFGTGKPVQLRVLELASRPDHMPGANGLTGRIDAEVVANFRNSHHVGVLAHRYLEELRDRF